MKFSWSWKWWIGKIIVVAYSIIAKSSCALYRLGGYPCRVQYLACPWSGRLFLVPRDSNRAHCIHCHLPLYTIRPFVRRTASCCPCFESSSYGKWKAWCHHLSFFSCSPSTDDIRRHQGKVSLQTFARPLLEGLSSLQILIFVPQVQLDDFLSTQ